MAAHAEDAAVDAPHLANRRHAVSEQQERPELGVAHRDSGRVVHVHVDEAGGDHEAGEIPSLVARVSRSEASPPSGPRFLDRGDATVLDAEGDVASQRSPGLGKRDATEHPVAALWRRDRRRAKRGAEREATGDGDGEESSHGLQQTRHRCLAGSGRSPAKASRRMRFKSISTRARISEPSRLAGRVALASPIPCITWNTRLT
jgi:hypothetical protein